MIPYVCGVQFGIASRIDPVDFGIVWNLESISRNMSDSAAIPFHFSKNKELKNH